MLQISDLSAYEEKHIPSLYNLVKPILQKGRSYMIDTQEEQTNRHFFTVAKKTKQSFHLKNLLQI